MLANAPSLCLATARAELNRFHLILSRFKRSIDSAGRSQCKANPQWHIHTLMWLIMLYLLRYFSTFSYSCWIMRLRRRRRLFPCTQEFAASRACIRPAARPANQRAPRRAALAPKTASAHTMGCARVTPQPKPHTSNNISDFFYFSISIILFEINKS